MLLSAITNTLDEDVDHLDSEEDSVSFINFIILLTRFLSRIVAEGECFCTCRLNRRIFSTSE